ncbi:TIGR02611 family protein [Candidatus Saccharibacteria bacterium]|jgi:uncharacterized protein (TIGR02611 family)|nr:TIGR02611 family protein [Candidatus Saccharibacteria bacterium]
MKRKIKKTGVGFIGGVVLVAGIIMIPYPGPGWVTVFLGLGILSTEFEWAADALKYAKGKYDAWESWMKRQSKAVKSFFWLLTAAVVIVTIWLLNGYGILNHLLGLGWNWLDSPLPIFN